MRRSHPPRAGGFFATGAQWTSLYNRYFLRTAPNFLRPGSQEARIPSSLSPRITASRRAFPPANLSKNGVKNRLLSRAAPYVAITQPILGLVRDDEIEQATEANQPPVQRIDIAPIRQLGAKLVEPDWSGWAAQQSAQVRAEVVPALRRSPTPRLTRSRPRPRRRPRPSTSAPRRRSHPRPSRSPPPRSPRRRRRRRCPTRSSRSCSSAVR